jgi:PAS domain-containing protein
LALKYFHDFECPTATPRHAPDAPDELLRAREALRQSQLELRALADAMPQLAWIAEQDGTMTWYNQRWYDYTGTTPEQMAGDGWKRAYAPDCLPAMEAHWEQSRRDGTRSNWKFRSAAPAANSAGS